MRVLLTVLIAGILSMGLVWGQALPDPESFLGYPLGSRFTLHHQMVAYVEALAAASPKVRLIPYGKTEEGRPLLLLAVSSQENLARLEEIGKNNRIATQLDSGTIRGRRLPVVWLNYNLHGDEAVSTEAAMACLYGLATGGQDTARWLEEMVVLVDPCANPDGRDHYVNWYLQASARTPNPSPDAWEHHPPWPAGRFNHYLIDLNRDWVWQTQIETQQRMRLFRQFMPQVLADFHEMGYESPYFFAPAAHPYHEEITHWQLEFSRMAGANHSRYFKKRKWVYYTSRIFDLFYPSYGDTYSMFNGAVGFTYEQGGAGMAGMAIARSQGDTLTLPDRLDHHVTVGFSTLEAVFMHRKRLLEAHADFFQEAKDSPRGQFKTYLVKGGSSSGKLRELTQLLDRQEIRYGWLPEDAQERTLSGFDYRSNSYGPFSIGAGDLVISAYQPQSRLLKVLMEPFSKLEDSLTYDLTAWALPYVFGVEAYASSEQIDAPPASWPASDPLIAPEGAQICAIPWQDLQSLQLLTAMLKQGIEVKQTQEKFSAQGKTFAPGTLLVPGDAIQQLSEWSGSVPWQGLNEMPDSAIWESVRAPKVALIGGAGVSPSSFGEIWHFLENDLEYPVHILLTDYLETVDLDRYDVVILPSGEYKEQKRRFLAYARQGGRLLLMEQAILSFGASEGEEEPLLLAQTMLEDKKKAEALMGSQGPVSSRYEDRDRTYLSNTVAGSIYRISLASQDPLGFGYPGAVFLIKRNNQLFPALPSPGVNVGLFEADAHISGFVGAQLKQKIPGTLAVGREPYGSGELLYFADSPVLRGFWYEGKLLMGNAVFGGKGEKRGTMSR